MARRQRQRIQTPTTQVSGAEEVLGFDAVEELLAGGVAACGHLELAGTLTHRRMGQRAAQKWCQAP
jgi:hypothetical protein